MILTVQSPIEIFRCVTVRIYPNRNEMHNFSFFFFFRSLFAFLDVFFVLWEEGEEGRFR